MDGELLAGADRHRRSTTHMRIPTWRLLLTGGAITILALAGIGFVAAANSPVAPAADAVAADPTGAPAAAPGERLGPRAGLAGPRLLRAGRHLVHAEVTVTDRDGKLVNLHFDHGTVQSIGDGKITISEAGGGTETVSTDDATIVRIGRAKGGLGDLKVGAEVFVQSRVDGSTVLAKRIVVIPAKAS
jgi:hypothetical protein